MTEPRTEPRIESLKLLSLGCQNEIPDNRYRIGWRHRYCFGICAEQPALEHVGKPALPDKVIAGYIGDGATPHKIVGSPYNTNFVRIEQLDPATGAVIGQVGFSDLFTLQGRQATNAGVDVDKPTDHSLVEAILAGKA